MNRALILATALLAAPSAVARGQFTAQDLIDAHSKRAPSGTTSSGDLVEWSVMNRGGWKAIGKGHYDSAEREFLAAIKIAKRPGVNDTRLIARSYADYAWAIQKQGRNAEAEPLAKWALTAREATLDPGSAAVAQSLNQLATLYYELGRYSEAEQLLRRAIGSQSKASKPSPTEQARSQTMLGLLFSAQRRYSEAEEPFSRAVKFREQGQGPNHPETGDCLGNLAWTYHEQGKDDEARPLFERALKIFEKSRGVSSPSVAHVLNGLGQILAKKGERAEAEVDFLRSIAIWEALPNEGLSLLDVLRHYADLLEESGKTEELSRIKARIAPLRAKYTLAQSRLGPWYRFPDFAPTADSPAGRMPG